MNYAFLKCFPFPYIRGMHFFLVSLAGYLMALAFLLAYPSRKASKKLPFSDGV